MSDSNQYSLLRQRRFAPFFATQALGAFNDNIFRNGLIILITFQGVNVLGMNASQIANVAGALFILPFFLFSAAAGQLADKYEKSRLIRIIKLLEIGLMDSGRYSAMWSHDSSGGGAGGLAAIYYPPPGHTPVDMFGPQHAFSISIIKGGQAKKENLDIKITALDEQYLPKGKPLALNYLNVTTSGAGIPHVLIFRPTGLVVEPGSRYWVAVSYDKGKTLAHQYLVEFVDVIKGG